MIPYILAAVGGYLIGDSLKGKQYAKGGKVEYVENDTYDQKYFRRFNDAIGSFGWMYGKNYNEGILYPLESFDKEYYSHIELKKDEVLLRYRTDRMVKEAKYLIKINLDKALIYFMSDSDSDDDKNPKFETRGIKAEYIVISKDYAPKIMAAGGMMAKGGTIEEQLEKINIYNDLDAYEYDQYKRMMDSGMPKVDALKVIINDVEGDTSQLSRKLASIAKKIKYSDGGTINIELNRLDHWQVKRDGFLLQVGKVAGEYKASISNDKGFYESKFFDSLLAASKYINNFLIELKHYQENKSISAEDVNENLFGASQHSLLQTIEGKRLYQKERLKELGLADESLDLIMKELSAVKSNFDKLNESQKSLIKSFLIKRKKNFSSMPIEEYLNVVKRLVSAKNLKETADEVYKMEKSLPEY
jgi:hypothetical protein